MVRAIAVGEKHLILCFGCVGFEVVEATDAESLSQQLARLSRDSEIGLVLVTESLAVQAPGALRQFRARSRAVLTLIPSHRGSLHASFDELRKTVERSLGVDLLGKE